jgi:hypothetical protein
MLILRSFARDLRSEAHMIGSPLIHDVWQLPLILLGLGGCVIARFSKSFRARSLIFYSVFAWAIGLFTMQNVGANINYLNEGWISFTLLAALTLDTLRRHWQEFSYTLQQLMVVFLLATLPWQAARVFSPRQVVDDTDPRVMALVQGKRVFSDVPFLSTHGTDPELLDAYTTTQLELHGEWSSSPLQDQIRAGSISSSCIRTTASSAGTTAATLFFPPT